MTKLPYDQFTLRSKYLITHLPNFSNCLHFFSVYSDILEFLEI